jgi:hypothetical protein
MVASACLIFTYFCAFRPQLIFTKELFLPRQFACILTVAKRQDFARSFYISFAKITRNARCRLITVSIWESLSAFPPTTYTGEGFGIPPVIKLAGLAFRAVFFWVRPRTTVLAGAVMERI